MHDGPELDERRREDNGCAPEANAAAQTGLPISVDAASTALPIPAWLSASFASVAAAACGGGADGGSDAGAALAAGTATTAAPTPAPTSAPTPPAPTSPTRSMITGLTSPETVIRAPGNAVPVWMRPEITRIPGVSGIKGLFS